MKFDDWWEQNEKEIKKQVVATSIYFMEVALKIWFQKAWAEGWNESIEVLKKE